VKTSMFKKILVANRGEIAVRILRTSREMGIRTVAVFSDVDRTAMHVRMADEAFPLRGNTAAETYLRQDWILEIAKRSSVDAIHPGYGFLSENPDFAAAVEADGVKFIGPSARAIRSLGDKTAARRAADELNIPTVPGTKEPVKTENELAETAGKIGYPVLLKAAAGGGGKGMRVVNSKQELRASFVTAQSEAKSSFGDDRVYVEKYLQHPRHIEIQVLADEHGNCVFLGERECSIQRRHQKLIEETPSPIVDDSLRESMGEAAVRLVRSLEYSNAGTVEFLVDESKKYYFLEVNTRLQVEHPVTEIVNGIDLVRQQILIASGCLLPFAQKDVKRRGHAIECRICAEDPEDHFFPSTGTLTCYDPPQGPHVRVDSGVSIGDEVSMFYDPLLAKVIAWGENRNESMQAMTRALVEFNLQGVRSTIPFCLFVLNTEAFRNGEFDTRFVETHFESAQHYRSSNEEEIASAVAAALLHSGALSQKSVSTNHRPKMASVWKRMRLDTHH